MIGKTFKTRYCGEVTVLSRNNDIRHPWRIKFLNTGFEKNVSRWQIVSGQLEDPYVPAVLGIGITGDVDYKKYGKLAAIWRDIIYRCNDPNSTSYKRYGAKGVSICKEWLYLPKFIEDVTGLSGFDWYLFNEGLLHLDKDTKQRFQTNKIYSKETCTWLSNHDNVRIQDGQMKPFRATDKNGNSQIFYNISEFARTHAQFGFTRRNVSAVLNRPHVSTCFGWRFEFIDPNKEIV